jgi:hypothetical protein
MSDTRTTKPSFGKVLAKAATSWVNLGVAGTAAVVAAALVSWPIAAIGGVAYVALVAWDVANPDFWKKTFGRNAPQAAKLPDPGKIADPALQRAARGIVDGRRAIGTVLAETPESVKSHLGLAVAQLAELEGRAATLIARGEDLARYLATVDAAAVRTEIEALAQRISRSRDAQARAELERAQTARKEQLAAIDEIDTAYDRIAAQLARIVATFEGLPPKIVRMRALDAQAMDDLSGNVNEELERMNGEIRTLEETLRTLAEVPAS